MSSQYTTLQTLVSAIRAKTSTIQGIEPEEITALRLGDFKIGTNNQYFTTWDFAVGIIRDLSMIWYPILETFEDEKFELEHAITIAERLDSVYSNYLRYSGFPNIGAFAVALTELLPRAKDRKEAASAARAYLAYLNRLASWSIHFFPWDLSEKFQYASPAAGVPADLSRRVKVAPGCKVKLTWQPLGISVVAHVAINENPELAKDFIEVLPFTVLQDHAVVSGELIYAWAPLVSTAPVRVKERLCDGPVGRICYSQRTGNKVLVQYGEITEDMETPVLGEILEEYASQLKQVGAAVLSSTFKSKENIFIKVELVE